MSRVSTLTLNRLSLYLRCLRDLEAQGVARISSNDLAQRYQLSSSQIRKDLAQFGEFGIRGVGYEVGQLAHRLRQLLGLNRRHGVVILGVGNLGTALSRFPGFNSGAFSVVGLFDSDDDKVGRPVGDLQVRSTRDLRAEVKRTRARLGVLAVPAPAAQVAYDQLCDAGVGAVLNFAPAQIRARPEVPVKSVDLRTYLEELAYYVAG